MMGLIRWPARIALAGVLTAGGVVLGDTVLPAVSYFRDMMHVHDAVDISHRLDRIDRLVDGLRPAIGQGQAKEELSQELARLDAEIRALQGARDALTSADVEAAQQLAETQAQLLREKRDVAIRYAEMASSRREVEATLAQVHEALARLNSRLERGSSSLPPARESTTSPSGSSPAASHVSNEQD